MDIAIREEELEMPSQIMTSQIIRWPVRHAVFFFPFHFCFLFSSSPHPEVFFSFFSKLYWKQFMRDDNGSTVE